MFRVLAYGIRPFHLHRYGVSTLFIKFPVGKQGIQAEYVQGGFLGYSATAQEDLQVAIRGGVLRDKRFRASATKPGVGRCAQDR